MAPLKARQLGATVTDAVEDFGESADRVEGVDGQEGERIAELQGREVRRTKDAMPFQQPNQVIVETQLPSELKLLALGQRCQPDAAGAALELPLFPQEPHHRC